MKSLLEKVPLFRRNRPPVVSLVSLGCAKNAVDSELILGRFVESGWLIAENPADSDLCLVNTCGFIQEARDEAATVLQDLRGQGRFLIVALGCLVKRAADCPSLAGFLDAADAQFSFDQYSALPALCANLIGRSGGSNPVKEPYAAFLSQPRLRFGLPHSAWLKISEGCSNGCAFCSIPMIRGRQVSRPMDELIAETRNLIDSGAVEIGLIAQDTTAYGRDLGNRNGLPLLLQRLRDEIRDDVWFRLMYACPQHLEQDVLEVLASDSRFCPYIDMPLQHISDRMLRAMGRPLDRERTTEKLALIRAAIPDAAIRTAFITGHPGETDEDFEELLDFIRQGWFTHAGVFAYSPEPGTRSAGLSGEVARELALERRDRLMEAQRAVSAMHCAARVGRRIEVLIDKVDAQSATARSQWEAPEVDGVIRLTACDAGPGDRITVRITGASDYDLEAEPCLDA